MLREQDANSILGSRGRLLGGVWWCIVAAIVVATVLTLAIRTVADGFPIGWGGWFLLSLIGLAGVVWMLNRRTPTDFVVGSLSATDSPEIERARTGPIVALLTWGPAAIVDGWAGHRRKWKAHQSQLFRRAAQMVVELAKYDGGVELRYVTHASDTQPELNRVIQWLDRHQWLGRSSDGKRIFLSTDGRKRLENADLLPKAAVRRL